MPSLVASTNTKLVNANETLKNATEIKATLSMLGIVDLSLVNAYSATYFQAATTHWAAITMRRYSTGEIYATSQGIVGWNWSGITCQIYYR